VNDPLLDAEHVIVDIPVDVRLVGMKLQDRPLLGEIVEVRATVPVKPLWYVTVTVEVALLPTETATLNGLGTAVKSETRIAMDRVVCVKEPRVPVTVTV
jgi:hypothetical protein